MRTAKTLIRLGGSESSIGAHSLCWFVMSRLMFYFVNISRYTLPLDVKRNKNVLSLNYQGWKILKTVIRPTLTNGEFDN